MNPSPLKLFVFSLILSSSLIKTDSVAVAMSGCSHGKYCSHSNNTTPFSCGMLVLAPVLISTLIVWTKQKNKMERHRRSLFDRNGGEQLKKKLLSRRKKSLLKIYTAEEMKNATNNYSDTAVMQRCNPGTFYRGNLENRDVVVMKIPTVPQSKVELFVDRLIFLSQPHTNLVKIIGCCLETCFPLLVYELHGDGNGTLFDCMQNEDVVTRVKAAAGAARGLANLQAAFWHGNICSGNILLDASFDAKVFYAAADRDIITSSSSDEGNCVYRDPEVMSSGRLDEKSDVYSFGVVLVELMLRRGTAENDRNNLATIVSLVKGDGLSGSVYDDLMMMWSDEEDAGQVVKEVAVMAARCLSVRTEERPSIKELEAKLIKFCLN